MIRLQFDSFAISLGGFRIFAGHIVSVTQIILSIRRLRIGRSSFNKCLKGLRVVFYYVICGPQVIECLRVARLQAQGVGEGSNCLWITSCLVKSRAEIVISNCVIWFEFDCLLQRINRLRELAQSEVCKAEIAEGSRLIR